MYITQKIFEYSKKKIFQQLSYNYLFLFMCGSYQSYHISTGDQKTRNSLKSSHLPKPVNLVQDLDKQDSRKMNMWYFRLQMDPYHHLKNETLE